MATENDAMINHPSTSDRRSRWPAILMTAMLLIAAGIAIGANMWKRELRVAHLHAHGNRIVTEAEILKLAEIRPNEQLFAVDLHAARMRVQQNLFIKSVAINREAPDGVTITITERIPIAAMVVDRILYLDNEGYVLPPARTDAIFDLPVLTGDLPVAECIPGKAVTSAHVREALDILATAREVGEDLYHLISEVHLEAGRDIVLYTAESGVPVVFGHGDVALKLVMFDEFWKQIVRQRGAAELTSVDLRFVDQVVVRWQTGDDAVAQ